MEKGPSITGGPFSVLMSHIHEISKGPSTSLSAFDIDEKRINELTVAIVRHYEAVRDNHYLNISQADKELWATVGIKVETNK